ncbi:MAG: AzlC family ABC transporter permease [Firmicutes bacterium]|nr:AzlC family ABC transporter permease [Bacillota bacterium]
MNNTAKDTWRYAVRGFHDGFPIFLGYLPPSMAFGMTAGQFHWAPWQIVLVSAILYAGTSQFVLLSLTAAHSPGWSSVVTVWMVNLRHVAYGPALTLAHSRKRRSLAEILSIGWGLTDEVFATVCRPAERENREDLTYLLAVAILAYAGWIGGTALGIGFGQTFLHRIPHASAAFGFALPALFLYILTGSVTARRRWQWKRMRLLVTVLALYVFLASMGFGMSGVLLAALLASGGEVVWLFRKSATAAKEVKL